MAIPIVNTDPKTKETLETGNWKLGTGKNKKEKELFFLGVIHSWSGHHR